MRGGFTTVIIMTHPGGTLRFTKPPVRGVSLTVFFAPIEGLLLTSLAPLVSEVKKGFPVVKERFAEMPWIFEDLDDDEVPNFDDDAFPFPYLTFANGSGQAINFQNDRFRLTWSFSDGDEYPGFEALRAQLDEHLSHFARHVAKEIGEGVAVSHVAVRYDNELGASVRPMDVMLRAYGIEAGAQSPSPHATDLKDATFHATVLRYAEGRAEEVYVISRHLDAGTTLGLRSTSRRPQPSKEGWGDLLDAAHDNLITVFDSLTTQVQKEKWGPIS
jgi:hypothetical protein